MKHPFEWDYYSDQPYQLKDRAYKKAMRRKNAWSYVKTILIALMVLPLAMALRPFIRRRSIDAHHFCGMSVNLDRFADESVALIQDLGVKSVLVRLPLWEMERLDEYTRFIASLSNRSVTVNVMQDREHVEDLELFERDMTLIFDALGNYVSRFQIGTTINRAKWGFFGVDEFLRFYRVAQRVRDAKHRDIKLIGPGVIDFEFHFTAYALFNFHRVFFDGLATLLYVDRRGAPENTQMGFSLFEKIRLQRALMMLSAQVGTPLFITETNWPISNTAPYAPTSEYECVDEETYAIYMLRYYLLAFASQQVDAVFWHQLIAPGYGLIDSREGLQKRKAYEVFRTMVHELRDAEFVDYGVFDERESSFVSYGVFDDRHTLTCKTPKGEVVILWSQHTHEIHFSRPHVVVQYDGSRETMEKATVGEKPIYVYLLRGRL